MWSPQGVIDMHRPERWGYVQFSTAAPGTVAFRPDPDAAIRDALYRIYYAQRDYRKRSGKWATSLDPLDVRGPWPEATDAPRLQTTDSLFEGARDRPPTGPTCTSVAHPRRRQGLVLHGRGRTAQTTVSSTREDFVTSDMCASAGHILRSLANASFVAFAAII